MIGICCEITTYVTIHFRLHDDALKIFVEIPFGMTNIVIFIYNMPNLFMVTAIYESMRLRFCSMWEDRF